MSTAEKNISIKDLAEIIPFSAPQGMVLSCSIEKNELVIRAKHENFVKLLSFLKEDVNCSFNQLTDIFAIDNIIEKGCFTVAYQLFSVALNQRARLMVDVPENINIGSVAKVFESAEWYEREIWDMYGIMFTDHNDMRRILNSSMTDIHPLRKDYGV